MSARAKSQPPRPNRGANARLLRIIGGAWRGRRLRFTTHADIRPTPDRVRETLFNWIGSRIVDARCLDLFAGSGALGLEAAEWLVQEGASHVVLCGRRAPGADVQARLAELQSRGATVTIEQVDATACVSVADQGIGIAQAALPNLFSRFYRAPNAQEQRIGGIGMGLYVVQEIVTLHGGTITVQSVEDQGSTFLVCIPSA